jgi:hypothetical protein
MDLAMFMYVMLCAGFLMAMIESIMRNGPRWSIADMLIVP